jgi:hypothetical protein
MKKVLGFGENDVRSRAYSGPLEGRQYAEKTPSFASAGWKTLPKRHAEPANPPPECGD